MARADWAFLKVTRRFQIIAIDLDITCKSIPITQYMCIYAIIPDTPKFLSFGQ